MSYTLKKTIPKTFEINKRGGFRQPKIDTNQLKESLETNEYAFLPIHRRSEDKKPTTVSLTTAYRVARAIDAWFTTGFEENQEYMILSLTEHDSFRQLVKVQE